MIQIQPLSNDAAFDRWQTDLLKEAINHRHSVWSIGDLLLEGERKFEDARYVQALEATRLTIETLMNYKSLAKCFPAGKRRLNLGVSHHEATRSLDEGARDAMLDLVEKHEISRENLRNRVKAYKGGDVGALAFNWKQPNKITEVEDSHAGVSEDDDKPVFDTTSAGEGMAGEKASSERPDFEATDAGQDCAKIFRAIERLDLRMVKLETLSRDSLQAAIAKLRDLAVMKAKHDQRHLIPGSQAAVSGVWTSSAGTDGDADRHINLSSAPAIVAASYSSSREVNGSDKGGGAESSPASSPVYQYQSPSFGSGAVSQLNAPSLSNCDVSAGEEPFPRVGPQAEVLHAGIGSGTLAVHDGHTQSGAAHDDEASVTNGQAAPSSIHAANATRAPNNAALSEAEFLGPIPNGLDRRAVQ